MGSSVKASMKAVVVVWVCVVASAVAHAIRLNTRVPFHDWVDTDSVLDGLSPAEEDLTAESFLELVAGQNNMGDKDDPLNMFALLDADPVPPLVDDRLTGKKGCDGSYNCGDFKEGTDSDAMKGKAEYYKPQQSAPDAMFPVGRIPRQARCYLTCDYQSSYAYTAPYDPDAGAGASASKAKSKSALAKMATTFLEEGSTTTATQDSGDFSDTMTADFLGSPFHCKTHCDFQEPLMCNPVRRMLVGATGYTPQEHACCDKCDKVCKGKAVLDRYRICNAGCRSFCPFVDSDLFE